MTTSKRAGATALVLVVALLVASATPAAAATEDEESDLLLRITESASNTDQSAAAKGLFGGRLASISGAADKWYRIALGDRPNATAQANELTAFVNQHDQALVAHTNRVAEEYNATIYNTTYVLQVNVVDEGVGSNETRYLVATGNGSNITSAHMQNATPNASVDRSRELDVFEAEDLNADLRTYRDEYVEPGEVPPLQYYINKAADYGAVSEIVWQDDSGWF
jgi:hypothetical protein